MPTLFDSPETQCCLLLPDAEPAYRTELGMMLQGKAEEVLAQEHIRRLKGQVQLVFTSPPFPLNRKKRYGNKQGEQYVKWIADFAGLFKELLTPNGSIVMELGNAWQEGEPVMSTLALESLLGFLKAGDLKLCQQFVAYNTARLPSPAQWVTIERIRVKDSYTHVWWMAKTSRPKACNRKVLKAYSEAMDKLLRTGKYNSGLRPSEFNINDESFLNDNGGAIPSNVLKVANTRATDPYLAHCKEMDIKAHPARMAEELPDFFINFLTDPGDLVLDPFGGSNTTGAVAERLGRRWISIEPTEDYISSSKSRFAAILSTGDEHRIPAGTT
jgi:hypothetical protein